MADKIWGVSDIGFFRPTFEEIINKKNKKAKELFGEDFDTGELTPQGKLFRVNAAAENKLLEIAEGVYYSIFPSTATGLSLDRVCHFANLTRDGEGSAMHVLRVYGEFDYTIPAGTIFKSEKGIEFYSIESVTINQEETAQDETVIYYGDVTVQCVLSGEVGNVTDITATAEVNTSITDVTYQNVVAYGTPIESDPELREKFDVAIQGLGTNNSEAIKANVLRVNGVNDVIIIDNNTDTDIEVSDNLTVLSRSYGVVVYSDSTANDERIAQAIYEKQPLGIMQSGIMSMEVTDDAGIAHIVKFSYVDNVDISVTVACNVDKTFPSNGATLIEDNIKAYINGLGIGDKVVYSRLYDYIYNVTGVDEVTALALNGGTANVNVPKISIAKPNTITVTVTEV